MLPICHSPYFQALTQHKIHAYCSIRLWNRCRRPGLYTHTVTSYKLPWAEWQGKRDTHANTCSVTTSLLSHLSYPRDISKYQGLFHRFLPGNANDVIRSVTRIATLKRKHTVFNKAGFVWALDLCLNPWFLRIYTRISLFTAFYLRVKHIHVYLHLYPIIYHRLLNNWHWRSWWS